MESKEDISVAIHRTLVEVYTLKEAGLSIVFPTWEDAPYDSDWGAIRFQQTGNGTVSPVYPNEQTRQKILHHLTNPGPQDEDIVENLEIEELGEKVGEETEVEQNQSLSPEEEELEASTVDNPEDDITPEDEAFSSASPLIDKSWLDVPLDDMDIKFTVGVTHKRVHHSSLTSYRS